MSVRLKDSQELIVNELLHIREDIEEMINKNLERGRSSIVNIKEIALSSIEEGRKRYREEKEKHSRQ